MTPDQVRAWRRENLISQTRLADKLGVQVLTIKRWEAGTTVPPPFLRLALEQLLERRNDYHQAAVVKGSDGFRAVCALPSCRWLSESFPTFLEAGRARGRHEAGGHVTSIIEQVS